MSNVNKEFDLDNKYDLEASLRDFINVASSRKDIRLASLILNDLVSAKKIINGYEDLPKITIFGSARLKPESSSYKLAFESGKVISEMGFLVVTGGGPGIMEAGLKGAKEGSRLGIGIDIPFEKVNENEVRDWPLSRQHMFITRKLFMMRNVDGFIFAPGGFGTHDELFEVLTLVHTGKAKPDPLILLENSDEPLWEPYKVFLKEYLVKYKFIEEEDLDILKIAYSPDDVKRELNYFYKNYVTLHYDGEKVDLYLRDSISESAIEEISLVKGVLEKPVLKPYLHSLNSDENKERNNFTAKSGANYTLSFNFYQKHWTLLYKIIDIVNNI